MSEKERWNGNHDSRFDRLERSMERIETNVQSMRSDIQDGFQSLNTNLSTIATAALNKSNGFNGRDVLNMLAGIGIFILALIYGLDKLGILPKLIGH